MIKKIFKFIKIALLLTLAAYFFSLIYVISFSLSPNLPQHADAILILGAKVNLNNTPSKSLYNRTQKAIILYKEKKVDYIITTGGVGLGKNPESKVAAKIIQKNNIPINRILEESSSHTTFENVAGIKKLTDQYRIRSLIVVSDKFHIARGVLFAKHFGFKPVYWDAPSLSYYNRRQIGWNYAREAAAILFYIPRILFT